jgi:hypothetical protein
MYPGSHVGFPISTKNTNWEENIPMTISARFGKIMFMGLEKKVEMLNFPN